MKSKNLTAISARQLIRERKERGFTLIELVIVLAVLGVLAAIGIPQLTGIQNEAELAGAGSNIISEANNLFAQQLLNGELDDDTAPNIDWTGNVCSNLNGLSDTNLPSAAGYTLADGTGTEPTETFTTITVPGATSATAIGDTNDCYLTIATN